MMPEPADDHNDSHCKVCGSDSDWKLLLCCETCSTSMHTYCCTPPFKAVPKGDWYCPECTAARELVDEQYGVQEVLSLRKVPISLPEASTAGAGSAAVAGSSKAAAGASGKRGSEAAAAAGGAVRKEWHIKWKNRWAGSSGCVEQGHGCARTLPAPAAVGPLLP
jgi:hypothetical protein